MQRSVLPDALAGRDVCVRAPTGSGKTLGYLLPAVAACLEARQGDASGQVPAPAALVVLPAMGFPVTVAALLISIEPLIDMARTALNVNGAITTGIVTTRFLGEEVVDDGSAMAAQP